MAFIRQGLREGIALLCLHRHHRDMAVLESIGTLKIQMRFSSCLDEIAWSVYINTYQPLSLLSLQLTLPILITSILFNPARTQHFSSYLQRAICYSTMAFEMLQPRMPRSSQDGLVRPEIHEPMTASAQLSHSMDPKDLECPSNWPLHRKLYTSFAAWLFVVAMYVISMRISCHS